MRKFNILILMILFSSIRLFANELLGDVCCDSIKLNIERTDSCCIKITIINPLCNDLAVDINKYNSNTSTYERKYFEQIQLGNTKTFYLCRENDENSIKYEIYFIRSTNYYEPACGRDFEDNFTLFKGEVDVSECCPCPNGKNNWINLYVTKDRNCDNGNGCRVLFGPLNIPEQINCYSHYCIEKVGESLTSTKSIINEKIENTSYCIPESNFITFKIYLLKSESQSIEEACFIEKTVGCNGAIDPNDSSGNPCTPDCFSTPWEQTQDISYQISNDCVVKVYFTYRNSCPPNGYQDLQILKIETIGCYGKTEKEIYKDAVEQLIISNPMNFNPRPNQIGCYDTWRIINSSCWLMQFYQNEVGHLKTVLIPCSTAVCCTERYIVCRDSSDNVTITSLNLSVIPSNLNCIIPPEEIVLKPYPPVSSSQCYAACDWLNIFPVDPFFGFKQNSSFEKNNNKFEINGNIININCKDNSKCEIKLIISDLLGNNLEDYLFTIQKPYENLDLQKIIKSSSGLYLYKIYIDGELIVTGKIIK
jgi:hypothetical protein